MDQKFQKQSSSAMTLSKYMKHSKNNFRTDAGRNRNIIFHPGDASKSRVAGSFDNLLDVSLPNYEKPTHSVTHLGSVYAFGANTNQGINRNYNEDRVSIILNAS